MAKFTPSKKTAKDFNDGVEYIDGDEALGIIGDVVKAESINNVIEGFLYAQDKAENAAETANDALEKIDEAISENVVPNGTYDKMSVGYATKAGIISSITIPPSAWNNKFATVNVAGISPTSSGFVVASDASAATWITCSIKANAQGNGAITFTCTTTPTVSVTAQITILS